MQELRLPVRSARQEPHLRARGHPHPPRGRHNRAQRQRAGARLCAVAEQQAILDAHYPVRTKSISAAVVVATWTPSLICRRRGAGGTSGTCRRAAGASSWLYASSSGRLLTRSMQDVAGCVGGRQRLARPRFVPAACVKCAVYLRAHLSCLQGRSTLSRASTASRLTRSRSTLAPVRPFHFLLRPRSRAS